MHRFTCLCFLMVTCIVPLSPAVAQDAARGEELFKKCRACHAVGANARHKVGPELNGVFGRKAGSAKDFNFSKAMRKAGGKGLVWNETSLDSYLEAPTKFLPKNKMAFIGIKDINDRKDLIAFLKTQAGSGN